jgi:NAD(P)-dependent dehydrogenase (short-subunit alcohol dehydrogenase family)
VQRSWFITGVSSGLGRHIAELLLERGDRVAGTVRKSADFDELKSKHGDRLWLTQLDVTHTLAVREVVNQAFREAGKIDVVVNNAGYGLIGAAEEFSDDEIDQQIATNLVGSIQVIRAAIPHLRTQGGGRIIQISSMGGQVSFPAASVYHATKWGIEGFIESIREEIGAFAISATIVEPGSTNTNFGKNLTISKSLQSYSGGAVGQIRAFVGDRSYVAPGDGFKTARAIVDTVGQTPPPWRLVTGSDAYNAIHDGLTQRLAELEAQKTLAYSTDR